MAIYSRFLIGSLCFVGLNLNVANTPAAQSERPFSMRVDVELVTTEVIALDKHGEPVRNLKKENFKLYEDGKQQEILSFDEVTEESAVASPANLAQFGDESSRPGKSVLIIFDDSTITSAHLKAARDSAATFVKQHMNPGDIFGVASFDMSLKIIQTFISDRDAVLKAIGKPAISSAAGPVGEVKSLTPLAEDSRRPQNLLRALNFLSMSIERIRGQKSILIYSESMYSSDYLTTLYTDTLKTARRCNVVFYTADPAGLQSPTLGGLKSRDKARSASNRFPSSLGNAFMFQRVGGATGSGETAGRSTGGASSATTGEGSLIAQSPGIDTTFSQKRPGQNLLRSLASETGGFSIFNTNDLDTELDKLDKQLSNYYILGFQSNNPKHDGAFRKLEVKTDLKGITLRYRKGYLDRRPLDTLTSSRQEKTLLNALASPSESSQLPLIFRASYFYDSPHLARILVSARIGLENATLKKKGGELTCDLNMMGVAYAEGGAISARFSQTLHLSFDKDKEQEFRKIRLPYNNYFKLRPGKYRLKLGVSDEGNNLGTTEQVLEIPDLPETGLAASSLIIPEQITKLPELIQNLQMRLLDSDDPMLYAGMQIIPSVENRLPVNSGIPVLFRIYNLSGSRDSWKLSANANLVDENGREIVLADLPLDQNLSQVGGGEVAAALTLPPKNSLPGRFKLVVEVSDAVTGEKATAQTEVEFYQKQ
jgi:VWFA-related protein